MSKSMHQRLHQQRDLRLTAHLSRIIDEEDSYWQKWKQRQMYLLQSYPRTRAFIPISILLDLNLNIRSFHFAFYAIPCSSPTNL